MKQFNYFLFIIICLFACVTDVKQGLAGTDLGAASAVETIPPPGDTARGLIGYYYQDSPGQRFQQLVLIRIDTVMNFDWGDGVPADSGFSTTNNDYSARWIGLIEVPVTGTYVFHTKSDDYNRFYINGEELINAWDGGCCGEHTGTIDLVAGKKYPVNFEFHENGGGASVYLEWEVPGIGRQRIPAKYLYAITPRTATKPSINPVQGLYEGKAEITLATPTPGASIHFTLDGSEPTLNSTTYDMPFDITTTTVVRARTFRDGMFASATASASYVIIPPLVSTPTYTPTEGIFDDTLKVFIHTEDDSTKIYYTLDGSTPDTLTSLEYVDSIGVEIDSTTRIKAIATKPGRTPSQIGSATFTILPPSARIPAFSVPEGEYDQAQTVIITSATPGAVIRYALNEDALNAASPVYSAPISITKTTTLKAYAEADSLRPSKVNIATYTIGKDDAKAAAPQFSSPAGYYDNILQVTLFTDTKGADIYYTTDGSTPNENSTVFFAPVQINDSLTIKAYAVLEGMKPSDVVSAKYVVSGQQIDTSLISSKLPTPELTISPNPASDQARISWTNLIYTLDGVYVTITDSKGTIVNHAIIKGGYTYYLFNTTTLSEGVYFIKVQSGNSVIHGKLIVGR